MAALLTVLVLRASLVAAAASPGGMPPAASLDLARASAAPVLSVSQAAIQLEPITVHELLGNAQPVQSSTRLHAYFDGVAATASADLRPAPLAATIRRRIPGLWRLSAPAGGAPQERVRVSIESAEGVPGVFSAVDASALTVPVAVRELAPRNVAIGREQYGLEGDVVLEIPTASLGDATRYRGRLVIRVEGY
jgi:hypothetical protein